MTDEDLIEAFLAIEGVPIDPELPKNWDNIAHESRPDCHRKIWGKPYIVIQKRPQGFSQSEWLGFWPLGVRYDVRCLDGGAWDRSTGCGCFSTLEESLAKAREIDG